MERTIIQEKLQGIRNYIKPFIVRCSDKCALGMKFNILSIF